MSATALPVVTGRALPVSPAALQPTLPSYMLFWGKASAMEGSTQAWHPVAYHSLDVAATVQAYLQARPSVWKSLAKLLGLSLDSAQSFAALLAALHDLGKFDNLFQAKQEALYAQVAPGLPLPAPQADQPHSRAGLVSLIRLATEAWFDDDEDDALEAELEPLLNATCGHHGRPELRAGARTIQGPGKAAARAYFKDLVRLLGVKDFPRVPAATMGQASMLLAGVISACDWVGSSQVWFPYQAPDRSLAEYWAYAQSQASRAIAAVQLGQPGLPARAGFAHLFPHIATPTPLQSFADTVALPAQPEPVLFLLEDATGAGKTEAAMTLASRLRAANFGDGVLVSLPTQTTTNSLFKRVAGLSDRFFEEGASHTATLAHGQANLALRQLLADSKFAAGISADLHSWASDSSKTALLTDFGVCSIDQVVMSVLPIKHVVMRRLGLHRKILVVDEAHACEPYLMQLLATTLETHAQAGGSAIVLSATLPSSEKERLAQAFQAGAARFASKSRAPAPRLRSPRYPLATTLTANALEETPIDAAKAPSDLQFTPIREAGADALVQGWLREGKCVCFLRNTVRSAQATFEHFNALFPGQVELVHARFAVKHRADNDSALLSRFGKEAPAEGRPGRLVIATQVAEQSLDVDFDEMVTDLAPLDALLQRAGRCRRHVRDATGAWLSAPGSVDGREPSSIRVVMPPVLGNEDFLSQLPAYTAFVYDLPAVLYRTALFVEQGGCVRLPEGVRALMEHVYEANPSVPEYLLRAQKAAAACRNGERKTAIVRQIDPQAAYTGELAIDPNEHLTTRLGEASLGVVLCNEDGKPLFGSNELSRVSIAASKLDIPTDERGIHRLHLHRTEPGVWEGTAPDRKGRSRDVRYSRVAGFEIKEV